MTTGSAIPHTGFGLEVLNLNQIFTFYLYQANNEANILYQDSQAGIIEGLAWQYLGIVYDYDQGKLPMHQK